MPDKRPVTNKELMKGSLIALAVHVSLAVLVGSACGTFGTNVSSPEDGLVREFSQVALLTFQAVTLLVSLIGFFVGKERGLWIGWIIGTALAMVILVSLVGVP